MMRMATDPGEALFKRYLHDSGYDILAYEPDLGNSKRPDFLISAQGNEIVAEVESFNTPPLPAAPPRSGFVSMVPQLRTVRRKITAGAEQLKGIEDRPLMVVLANPRNSWVPLEGPMFIGAMYGDMQASFTPDGDLILNSGRNGRLHVTEPDGSVRGNHPYLSAVAVLRFTYPPEAWAAALTQSQAEGHAEPLAVTRRAQQLVAQLGEQAASDISLDVYETTSESAIPLPRDIFNGPHDTRWGVASPGRYGQLSGWPR